MSIKVTLTFCFHEDGTCFRKEAIDTNVSKKETPLTERVSKKICRPTKIKNYNNHTVLKQKDWPT